MKITESSTFVNLDAYARQIEGNRKGNGSNNKITESQMKDDEVVFSPTATKINEAKRNLDSLPDIREQKIAQLKMQIQERSYPMDETKIASRMIKESLLNEIL
jgi:flagellar biosynthesis anti-sigma factor FlgM